MSTQNKCILLKFLHLYVIINQIIVFNKGWLMILKTMYLEIKA